MPLVFQQVDMLPVERYAALLGRQRMQEIFLRIAELRMQLSGRVIWNVSSTAVGGGVAEMVRSLLAYARGADVDTRWVIIQASPEFFRLTKRLHHALHGSPGDGSPLGRAERQLYERVARELVSGLAPLVRPRDVVIVHDLQPLGMVPELARTGTKVIWRCHIGSDTTNPETERGWSFLAPYLKASSGYVFSRAAYIPARLDSARATIIPPSIDPFSAKNQVLGEAAIRAILIHAGILEGHGNQAPPLFSRNDGALGRVDRYAEIVREGGPLPADAPLVLQVSRWDRLKDPVGVLRGFARLGHLPGNRPYLVLAGPNIRSVADDPEDAAVFGDVVTAWRELPADLRRYVHLAALPTADIDQNAAIVNALQRHAAVVVQKSLHEGFGLTVTEALWKYRAVLASAVGGIKDQIDNGIQGLLLPDPADLGLFARTLKGLLEDAELRQRLGQNGHARVLERHLGIDALLRYGALIERLDAGLSSPGASGAREPA